MLDLLSVMDVKPTFSCRKEGDFVSLMGGLIFSNNQLFVKLQVLSNFFHVSMGPFKSERRGDNSDKDYRIISTIFRSVGLHFSLTTLQLAD